MTRAINQNFIELDFTNNIYFTDTRDMTAAPTWKTGVLSGQVRWDGGSLPALASGETLYTTLSPILLVGYRDALSHHPVSYVKFWDVVSIEKRGVSAVVTFPGDSRPLTLTPEPGRYFEDWWVALNQAYAYAVRNCRDGVRADWHSTAADAAIFSKQDHLAFPSKLIGEAHDAIVQQLVESIAVIEATNQCRPHSITKEETATMQHVISNIEGHRVSGLTKLQSNFAVQQRSVRDQYSIQQRSDHSHHHHHHQDKRHHHEHRTRHTTDAERALLSEPRDHSAATSPRREMVSSYEEDSSTTQKRSQHYQRDDDGDDPPYYASTLRPSTARNVSSPWASLHNKNNQRTSPEREVTSRVVLNGVVSSSQDAMETQSTSSNGTRYVTTTTRVTSTDSPRRVATTSKRIISMGMVPSTTFESNEENVINNGTRYDQPRRYYEDDDGRGGLAGPQVTSEYMRRVRRETGQPDLVPDDEEENIARSGIRSRPTWFSATGTPQPLQEPQQQKQMPHRFYDNNSHSEISTNVTPAGPMHRAYHEGGTQQYDDAMSGESTNKLRSPFVTVQNRSSGREGTSRQSSPSIHQEDYLHGAPMADASPRRQDPAKGWGSGRGGDDASSTSTYMSDVWASSSNYNQYQQTRNLTRQEQNSAVDVNMIPVPSSAWSSGGSARRSASRESNTGVRHTVTLLDRSPSGGASVVVDDQQSSANLTPREALQQGAIFDKIHVVDGTAAKRHVFLSADGREVCWLPPNMGVSGGAAVRRIPLSEITAVEAGPHAADLCLKATQNRVLHLRCPSPDAARFWLTQWMAVLYPAYNN